jgi:thiamine biosynthesis protein ThiI
MQSETSDNDQPSTRNDVIVLRVSEIFLKGKNRHAFWRALVRSARRLLGDLEGVRVQSSYMRVAVVHPPALRQACIDRLQRLFGMASMAPSTAVATDLDAICAAAVDTARARPGQSFKIESKRRDKSFPMTSQEVSRHVGGEVVRHTGRPVDVHHPDQIIHVEIGEHSYVFGEIIPGPGGLPVGTAGNVGLLLSGGIDSPVAGWLAMRRGCHINPIYFHSFPYTGDKTREKVLDLARILARWQGRTSVHVVHFTEVQKALRDHGKAELAVLLYRRMMMRAASILAERERCKALITGENLGQVASQTLENLGVIEDAAALPVLRPLITYNKVDIVTEAQRIGTYETSILPYDDCCSLFVPKHPATRARVTDLAHAEAGLDVAALAVELADRAERIVVKPG